jgi:hypothetical protein
VYLSLHFQVANSLPSPILLARFLYSGLCDYTSRFDNGAYPTTLTLTTQVTQPQHRLICVTRPTKMRRYDIVSGILLILSIIDFALAAPVLAQEKRQAGVDALHIPKDVIAVLGTRVDPGSQEVERLLDKYFKDMGNPAESSDAAHASSSSAAPVPVHGSTTDAVQAPEPNPASSTANPDPSIGPPGSSAVVPTQGLWKNRFNAAWGIDVFSFRIKATMRCKGCCTPFSRQILTRTMD